jgi:uncharacterized protein (TIGR01244 family)
MSKFMLFVVSVVVTTGTLLAVIYANRPERAGARIPDLMPLNGDIFLTSQLAPEHMRPLRNKGIRSVIDIRPDGEAAGQPSSDELSAASIRRGMKFHYVPVPHETIPDEAVDALRNALTQAPRPTVLYCRTGRRAARTFALAEASRVDGPDTQAILEMVRSAGFTTDDLREKIAERISRRSSSPAARN